LEDSIQLIAKLKTNDQKQQNIPEDQILVEE
jgi:hypothetical protein